MLMISVQKNVPKRGCPGGGGRVANVCLAFIYVSFRSLCKKQQNKTVMETEIHIVQPARGTQRLPRRAWRRLPR